MRQGQKQLLEQIDILHELAEANVCRMPDALLLGISSGIKAVVSKEYVRGISREDVARFYGVSTRQLERWANRFDDFPTARHHGGKNITYDYEEVIKWRRDHQTIVRHQAK